MANMCPRRTRHDVTGVTLIELLLVLAIMAVLGAMALPPCARLLQRDAVRSGQRALVIALHEARLQAVRRDTRVIVCPSADGSRCGHSRHWGRGWLVAVDADRDGQPDGRILLRGHAPKQVAIVGSRGRPHVRFRGDGAAPGDNLTLTVCSSARHVGAASGIVVANSGRVRRGRPDAAARARCRQLARR